MNNRIRFYLFFIWILTLLVLLTGTFFTVSNNKLSFSYKNNDVYEVDRRLLRQATVFEDHEEITFEIFPDHGKYNYLRVGLKSADEINNDIYFGFNGSRRDGTIEVSLLEGPLSSNNYYRLPSQKFDVATVVIYGATMDIIDTLQLRENIHQYDPSKTIVYLLLVTCCYCFLTSICIIVIKYKQKIF